MRVSGELLFPLIDVDLLHSGWTTPTGPTSQKQEFVTWERLRTSARSNSW